MKAHKCDCLDMGVQSLVMSKGDYPYQIPDSSTHSHAQVDRYGRLVKDPPHFWCPQLIFFFMSWLFQFNQGSPTSISTGSGCGSRFRRGPG